MADDLKLFIVHVGFYDEAVHYGVYESHTNFLVAAASAEEAKQAAKANPLYAQKNMHTDGIQEVEAVQGCRISLTPDPALNGQTLLHNVTYRDLHRDNATTND